MPHPSHSFLSQQSNSNNSFYQSILIISLILTLVFLITFSIHLLLRFLDRILRSSSPPPLDHPLSDLHVSSSKPLIHSLPLFSFDSAVTAPDCAVCLSRFNPRDQLRLLPACGHAFHSRCIDTWLTFNRTCPLCRSTIQVDESPPSAGEDSFRVDNVVDDDDDDDDVEAQVVVGPSGGVAEFAESAKEDATGAEVAEAVGGGRGWLKEYLDRLASSASSRALSLRLSGRSGGRGVAGSSRRSDDVVGNSGMSWDMDMVGEDGSYFFRWLMGA